MSTNTVTLVGNLVDDPEMRFTPSGVPMVKLRFAVNRRWRDQNNEWQEETGFFSGTLWREHAENVSESLQKGARVIVTGRLEQRSWENQEGEKRSVVEINIEEIGPSLRWATATVNKTARSGGGDFSGAAERSIPPGPIARDDFGPDEAPF